MALTSDLCIYCRINKTNMSHAHAKISLHVRARTESCFYYIPFQSLHVHRAEKKGYSTWVL